MYFAGAASERLFAGEFSRVGSTSDLYEVLKLTTDATWRRQAWLDAHELIKSNKQSVARVAALLAVARRLPAKTVRHVVRGGSISLHERVIK